MNDSRAFGASGCLRLRCSITSLRGFSGGYISEHSGDRVCTPGAKDAESNVPDVHETIEEIHFRSSDLRPRTTVLCQYWLRHPFHT
jgi:hypothetical protein